MATNSFHVRIFLGGINSLVLQLGHAWHRQGKCPSLPSSTASGSLFSPLPPNSSFPFSRGGSYCGGWVLLLALHLLLSRTSPQSNSILPPAMLDLASASPVLTPVITPTHPPTHANTHTSWGQTSSHASGINSKQQQNSTFKSWKWKVGSSTSCVSAQEKKRAKREDG